MAQCVAVKSKQVHLKLPERIPLRWMAIYATIIACAQILEHTNPVFAGMQALYLVIGGWVFNKVEGFNNIVGAYVFWYTLLTIPVASLVKVLINERADGRSWDAMLTMSVYLISMILLAFTAIFSRRLTKHFTSLAQRMTPPGLDYGSAAIGSFCIWLAISFGGYIFPVGPGTVMTALYQVNEFGDVAVLLAVIDAVRSSGGQRSWNWLVVLCGGSSFLFGLIGFSKAGMMTPLVCWAIGLAYTRFRFRPLHIVVAIAITIFSFEVLYPIAQIGRFAVPAGAGPIERLEFGLAMFPHIEEYRQIQANAEAGSMATQQEYFGKNVGFAGRLTRWEGDDHLIYYSDAGHYVGYQGYIFDYINWIPHALFPDKERYAPEANSGNYYAREIGILPPSDATTGVSFGPPAEAFHMGGWAGLFILLPVTWVLLFVSSDMLCGDTRRSPWGLLVALYFAHVAPESGVGGLVYFVWYSQLGLVLAMTFSNYVAPLIGSALSGQRNTKFVPTMTSPAPTLPAH